MPTSPASRFADLRGFKSEVDEEPLLLPIGGVTYSFSKSIPFRTGLAISTARAEADRITKAIDAGEEPDMSELEQFDEQQVMRDLFGDQWERMLADGVHDTEFRRVYETLFTWHMVGEEAALIVWERKGDARPPARSASKARTTSRSSSSQRKPSGTGRTRSAGKTS